MWGGKKKQKVVCIGSNIVRDPSLRETPEIFWLTRIAHNNGSRLKMKIRRVEEKDLLTFTNADGVENRLKIHLNILGPRPTCLRVSCVKITIHPIKGLFGVGR